MQMYSDYLAELYGAITIVEDFGFCVIKPMNDQVWHIAEFYVKPEHRGTEATDKLFNRMVATCRASGARAITSCVKVKGQNGSHISIAAQIKRGLLPFQADDDIVSFMMKL